MGNLRKKKRKGIKEIWKIGKPLNKGEGRFFGASYKDNDGRCGLSTVWGFSAVKNL